ncbi:MAG: hypothetical protein V7L01_05485 [Nostoc sp.]
MQHDEFIGQVQNCARLSLHGDAELATPATLETPGLAGGESSATQEPRGGSISPLQIYLAIRNRGYTNQVRLRGLKKLETHGGGFCLYSREFYSPGLDIFLRK